MPEPHPRVASLLPAATELISAMGALQFLVGRSHACDHPSDIEPLPVLTAPRASISGSRALDRAARGHPVDGSPLYSLLENRLRLARPDIIIMREREDADAPAQDFLRSLRPTPVLISLNPTTPDDVLDGALGLGNALGVPEAARRLVARLRERLSRASEFVNPYTDGPTVAFLEWTDPVRCAGRWTVQLIERAGARHPLNPSRARSDDDALPTDALNPAASRVAGAPVCVPHEVLAAVKPDAVIIAPRGVPLRDIPDHAAHLFTQKWWADLPAVRAGRVALVDGNHMFHRPGPRLVDAFEWLVGWLHDRPEIIPAGFPWCAAGH